MINKTILGYTILSRLGEGGMAEVYYAENKIHKKAAIKFLKKKFCDDENIVTRFKNEAEVMVALDHPNIRQVFDYAELDGQPAIIQEYLEGNDLKSLIKSGKHFSDAEMTKLWNDITDALNYTHSKGIVHRDIKPSNIFITERGVAKILDFGIAKIKGAVTGTQTGQKMGTLIYMSPEQIKDSKHIDYKTDVYSLAVTFVHILKGQAPYDDTQSSEWEIMNKIVSEPLDMNGVPGKWKDFLKPYLAKNPTDRPSLHGFTTDGTEQSEHSFKSEVTIVDNPTSNNSAETIIETSNKFTVNGVSFEMVDVEGGTFWMGVHCKKAGFLFNRHPDMSIPNYDEDALEYESPVHQVTLSSFKIGKYQVTQELWQAVMGNNPSCFKGNKNPVEQVSWNDCQDFIRKLNQMTGQNFRLPTEAEWEYAARGGNKSRGYKYSGSNSINDVAWFTDNSGSRTHQVGTKSPNELGVYDMSGNVWEWCQDWYGDYGKGSLTNPKGASSGSCRVCRGGSWDYHARCCRVSIRSHSKPDYRFYQIGFRLVVSQ